MKKFIGFIFMMLLAVVLSPPVEAQKQYSHTGITTQTLTSAVAITVVPRVTECNYLLSADTNVTFAVTTTYVRPGAKITYKVTANTTDRTLTWGSNIDGPTKVQLSGTTVLYEFLYDGTTYNQISDKSLTYDGYTQASRVSRVADTLVPTTSYTLYTLTADTNITFAATLTGIRAGAIVVMKVTASGADRIMVFGANITGLNDTITSGKIQTYTFVYDGTELIMIGNRRITHAGEGIDSRIWYADNRITDLRRYYVHTLWFG